MSVKQQILEHLEEFTGETRQDSLLDIYTKYRISVLEKIKALCESLPKGDFNELYEISHALKGASNIVGYNDMWRHAANFVEGTKAKDISKCETELEQMRLLALLLEE